MSNRVTHSHDLFCVYQAVECNVSDFWLLAVVINSADLSRLKTAVNHTGIFQLNSMKRICQLLKLTLTHSFSLLWWWKDSLMHGIFCLLWNFFTRLIALTLLVVCQEEHPACKNWVMRYWCGYLSGPRCRLFAYGPADATAIPKSHHRLPYLNSDWYYLSGASLARLSWKRGRYTAVVVVAVVVVIAIGVLCSAA